MLANLTILAIFMQIKCWRIWRSQGMGLTCWRFWRFLCKLHYQRWANVLANLTIWAISITSWVEAEQKDIYFLRSWLSVLPKRNTSSTMRVTRKGHGKQYIYVPEVLGTPRVFPNTDRPRPANNMFIIFFRRVLCKQFLCWIFTAAIFKPGVRMRLTFRK